MTMITLHPPTALFGAKGPTPGQSLLAARTPHAMRGRPHFNLYLPAVKISGASTSPPSPSSSEPQASSSSSSHPRVNPAKVTVTTRNTPPVVRGSEETPHHTTKTRAASVDGLDDESDLGAFLMATFDESVAEGLVGSPRKTLVSEDAEGWVVLPPFPSEEDLTGELTAY